MPAASPRRRLANALGGFAITTNSDSMAVDLAPLSPVSSTDLDWEGSDSDSAESPDYSMSEASDASDAD